MNILIEGGKLNPISRGEGTRNIALTYARKLKKEGHNVIIITRRKNKDKTIAPKFEVYEGIKFYRWTNLLHLFFLLKKVTKKEKVDAIDIFAKGSRPILFMLYLKYFLRKPIIFNLLGNPFSKKYKKKKKTLLALSLADKVLVSSKTIYSFLIKNLKNIEYFPYGIDTKKFSPKKSKIKNQKEIILCLRRPKESLLNAIEKISKEKKIVLLLNKRINNLRNTKNFEINIQTIGYVKNISKIFNQIDLLVDLQPKKEFIKSASPPLMILEAMSCGVKVLSTKNPEVEEIIKDRIDGFLVKENEIKHLEIKIKEALSAKRVGTQARETILKRYNLNKIIKEFIKKQKKG